MRRNGQPSLPSAMTCCFFDSFKTLLMPTEPTGASIGIYVRNVVTVGRFSGDYHWPVLGDYRGLKRLKNSERNSSRLASHFSGILFPRLMSKFTVPGPINVPRPKFP